MKCRIINIYIYLKLGTINLLWKKNLPNRTVRYLCKKLEMWDIFTTFSQKTFAYFGTLLILIE